MPLQVRNGISDALYAAHRSPKDSWARGYTIPNEMIMKGHSVSRGHSRLWAGQLPAEDLAHTQSGPSHAGDRNEDEDDIHNTENRGAHHEARVEDAVEHEMAAEMAGPHCGGQVDGSEVEDVSTGRLDDVGEEVRGGVS